MRTYCELTVYGNLRYAGLSTREERLRMHSKQGCQPERKDLGCTPSRVVNPSNTTAVVIAKKNTSKNKKQIKFLNGDFLDKDLTFSTEQFDLIISNPPFRKINSGRMNLDEGKAIARHELKLNLQDMLEKAKPFLKKGGHITLAYPPIRLQETLSELENQKLFPSRIRFIHGKKNAEAKIFLIDAIKGKKSDLIVELPLYVYNKGETYTKEMQEVYDSFNCIDGSDHIRQK